MKRILSLFLIIVLTLSMAPSIHADAATIKLSQSKATMDIASTVKLNLGKISGNKVTWTSSKKTVATVSKWGTIIAKSAGKATITAKYNNKKYMCKVTVIDFTKWIVFETDDYDYVRDGILAGKIYYYKDDYYLVSPEYYKSVIEPLMDTISDAESEFANDYGVPGDQHTLDPDTEFEIDDESKESDAEYNARLQERINEMLKSGAASSESLITDIAKAYKEFCKTWVSESELKNTYKISAVRNWPKNQIYLMQEFDNKLIIENVPDKFVNGDIYSSSGVQYQYLEKFVYEGESYIEKQFYFNREDLISVGVIK